MVSGALRDRNRDSVSLMLNIHQIQTICVEELELQAIFVLRLLRRDYSITDNLPSIIFDKYYRPDELPDGNLSLFQ